MNTIRPFRPLGPLMQTILSLALVTMAPFHARAQYRSFQPTNVLSGSGFGQAATIIQGVPTNAPTKGTGGALSVLNYDTALLCLRGYVCTNIGGGSPTTNNVAITLVRSPFNNPPGVQTGTNLFTANGTNVQSFDYENWSNATPFLMPITAPVNVTTGYWSFYTNLPVTYLGGVYWLGIAAIQADFTNGFITNFDVGLSTKILPIRYP